MNRTKKLCILLGILIAACLAALAAMHSEEKKEEIKTSGETVLSVESAKVTALCWEQDGTTWSRISRQRQRHGRTFGAVSLVERSVHH